MTTAWLTHSRRIEAIGSHRGRGSTMWIVPGVPDGGKFGVPFDLRLSTWLYTGVYDGRYEARPAAIRNSVTRLWLGNMMG